MVSTEIAKRDPARMVLVFGPQVLNLDAFVTRRLNLRLRESQNNWILQLADNLPSIWGSLANDFPKFKCIDGKMLLRQLADRLRTGAIWDSITALPNVLLSPLTVIVHLAQYSALLEFGGRSFDDTGAVPASMLEGTEAFGLCIGTLSAFAVGCSSSRTELQNYGAAAVRLALLVGAIVDADDIQDDENGQSSSISVSWTSAESNDLINSVIQIFSDAYISVCVDEKRMTITASKTTLPKLIDALKTAGLHTVDVKMSGRFHWPKREKDLEELLRFCDGNPKFQLPDASNLFLSSTSEGHIQPLISGKLHEIALRDILLNQSNWVQRFGALHLVPNATKSFKIICFGTERCVPPSVARRMHSHLSYISNTDHLPSLAPDEGEDQAVPQKLTDPNYESIAVVGMACRVAGANDLEEYWTVLLSGQSQHEEVPVTRFSMETTWRKPTSGQRWFGNFIRGHDQFDHKFFKKSPREAASTDPQQRLALQVAYQAVEQSGYFNTSHTDKHIGCYTGISIVDYERNVACHPPNAYSAVGNVKGFVVGNISHYFGWTGPSMTIDAACAASGVAIHQACRAILGGECTAALAGGVSIHTSPDWYYNLSGASFLSPTGQCKPFDAGADGYCRGEGVGFVFLKKLSDAMADGDHVHGIIASTRVSQNQNCTAITVPNAPSLSSLFRDVVRQAKLEPYSISLVEAHGTGTPVGDPAEYDAIRTALAGPNRPDTLYLSSAKGTIGHCEVASGVLSLIKVLLMLSERSITPQASFTSINPSLKAVPEDMIEISTRVKPWIADTYAALINNYGASGSNASMIVTQPPAPLLQTNKPTASLAQTYPFWFSGLDSRSIQTYITKFQKFLKCNHDSLKALNIGDISFGLSRQSNRSLPRALVLTARSMSDLQSQLSAFEKDGMAIQTINPQPSRPVILCFGGQTSTFVGLDRAVYDGIAVFRNHLDQCNTICISMGLDNLLPAIFQQTPVQSTVQLQCALFAMQYSCAMSWIDCGLQVTAVVGHSFGELVALCVAGALSLQDSLSLVSSRASIVERCWGDEKGSMIAIEADIFNVEQLLLKIRKLHGSSEDPSIACYNGPRSFTLAGSKSAIQLTEEIIECEQDDHKFKAKKLNVTNAYHSVLVDSLVGELELLGASFTYNEPAFRIERATESYTRIFGSNFVAEHMRKPVFFNHAVQRLAQEFPSAIWLEAGSNSSVTNMASRALGGSELSHFESVNLRNAKSVDNLVSTTTRLWNAGLSVSYWAHHKAQARKYKPVLLPPYQFAETRHWMGLKEAPKPQSIATEYSDTTQAPMGLTTFLGYQSKDRLSVRFRVNVSARDFQKRVEANIVLETAPVLTSIFQMDIMLHAMSDFYPNSRDGSFTPEMRRLSHQNICSMSSVTELYINANASNEKGLTWQWSLSGIDLTGASVDYTSGTLVFKSSLDGDSSDELATMKRVVGRRRCIDLLNDVHADEVLQGHSIYRAFDSIVRWTPSYRNLTKIAAKGLEAAGRIEKTHADEVSFELTLSECFSQVASIHINLMMESCDPSYRGVFICNKIDRWIRNPAVDMYAARKKYWEVFTTHHRISQSAYISDIFAFDPQDGSLIEAILGAYYQQESISELREVLSSSTSVKITRHHALDTAPRLLQKPSTLPPATSAIIPAIKEEKSSYSNSFQASPAARIFQSSDVSAKIRDILCDLSGLEPSEIQEDSDLIELGIDSLMAMEVVREIEAAFKCKLSIDRLMKISVFRELVTCISSTLDITIDQPPARTESKTPPSPSEADMNVNGVRASSGIGDIYTVRNDNKISIENGIHTREAAQINPATDLTHVNYRANLNGNNGVSGQTVPRDQFKDQFYEANQSFIMPKSITTDVFQDTKRQIDHFVKVGRLGGYTDKIAPQSTELCIVYILDAFEQLGTPIRSVASGQQIERVSCLPKHRKQLDLLYVLLEREARLIDVDGNKITRTATSPPLKSAEMLLAELLRVGPAHAADHELTALLGRNLASCLTGKTEGVQLMFTEGRELMMQVYGDSPFMGACIFVLESFFENLLKKLPPAGEPLCILEIGAGTGGTTSRLLPILAAMGRSVRYTMTDISGSLVAASRKRFRHFDFIDFRVLDIESEPDTDLLESQHIVLSANCIHATRKLSVSLGNMHRMLRSDGFLILLELTERVPWVDFVFGLVEGWWLFEDDRSHALSSPTHWESVLRSVGYSHVDWTDGDSPESKLQRLIIAHKSKD